MPTYEYRCPEGHAFDLFQKMSDQPRADCPVCGREAARKISGGAGLVFKGSGFYITDYGKDGKGPRKAPSEGGDKPSEGGSKPAEAGSKSSEGGGKPAEKAAAEAKPARTDKGPAAGPKPKKASE